MPLKEIKMTEKDIIENLKDKSFVRAFGLMKPEEQEVYRKMTKGNCIFYTSGGQWSDTIGEIFLSNHTYAIKPDYQPEPEYVDLEIVTAFSWLGIWRIGSGIEGLPYDFIHLHCLPSLPNFEGFYTDKYPKGQLVEYQRISYRTTVEKKKVYARFRRQ